METKSKASGLRKKQNIFGRLFLYSILVFFASTMFITHSISNSPHSSDSRNFVVQRQPDKKSLAERQSVKKPARETTTAREATTVIVSVVSLLTSVTSLIGFCFTTLLAWRKEKRESRSEELELKKKEFELEKLRKELVKFDHSTDPQKSDNIDSMTGSFS
jgi:multidrug efflux pump subunit AcrB